MNDADEPQDLRPQIDPDLPVLLGELATDRHARELSLVLRARSIPHEMRRSGRGFALIVPARHVEEAQAELAQYGRENEDWPPRRAPPAAGALWLRATVLYVATIVLLFAFQRGEAFGLPWYEAGLIDGARIRAGEWTRTLTALTLHADLVHLLSNVTYGALFGGLVAYSLGGGVAWLSVLASGALGNLLNVWIHGFEHRSLGASTAVFGAVGVLAGSEVVRRHLTRERRLRRAAPVLVAFLLVSYLGLGGAESAEQRTDVSAHITGLVAGFVLGAPLGALRSSITQSRRAQWLAGGAALLALAGAWALQLNA